MAKATVTPTVATFNGDSAYDAETITTDGAEITPIKKSKNLMILVQNTDASDVMTVTVTDTTTFTGKGVGDLSIEVAASGVHWIGPVEGHRFLDADGKIQMDFSSTGTLAGKVSAVELP